MKWIRRSVRTGAVLLLTVSLLTVSLLINTLLTSSPLAASALPGAPPPTNFSAAARPFPSGAVRAIQIPAPEEAEGFGTAVAYDGQTLVVTACAVATHNSLNDESKHLWYGKHHS